MKIVLVTGGFDPLHSGHISYLQNAKALGDHLIVGVNSDAWLARKKGRPFMPIQERANVIQAMRMVDAVIAFDETYDANGSAIKFIEDTLSNYPEAEVIFANGGDRTPENIPEMQIENHRLSFEFGVGGEDKKNSSSWILKEWRQPKTERDWGCYNVLHTDGPETKVKELIVNPKRKLSMQRHFERNELWMVTNGIATVTSIDHESVKTKYYKKHEIIDIPTGVWHQLENETTEELRVVEIQFGKNCDENDIERRKDYK